jgi:outer membrane lipoprotein SlyB
MGAGVNVHMKTLESIRPRAKLVRIAARASYLAVIAAILGWSLAVIAAIVGWSLPNEWSSEQRVESPLRLPAAALPGTAGVRSTLPRPPATTRGKVNCDECGVVESVRRIDTREGIMGWCAAGDVAGTRIPDYLSEAGERRAQPTFGNTVAGVIAGDQDAKNVRVTTRHEIVVRFRDGSRQILNEATPRTLRAGDRIRIIAGASGARG